MERRLIEVYRADGCARYSAKPLAVVYSMPAAKAVSRLYPEWMVFRYLVKVDGRLHRVVSMRAYSGVLIGEE